MMSAMIMLLLAGCSAKNDSNVDTSTSSTVDTTSSQVDTTAEVIEEDESISFLAVGDNLIHSQIFVDSQVGEEDYDFKPRYENVVDDIAAADLAFVNQESLIGGDDIPFTSYPTFNTPSQMAGDLADLGFNLVSLANNHTLDKGTQAVKNTLAIWEEQSDRVLSTGAFDSQEARDTIPTIEKEGVVFSLLAYTYGTNGIEPDVPYRLNYFDEDLIRQDVARAKEESDVVLVSAHWGDEYSLEANDFQKRYAQLFADLEVDVVIGTHSHTIQPIEWVTGENGNETLVIYSLGNFLASTPNDVSLLGGMVTFDFVKPELEIENVYFEPLVIHYDSSNPTELMTRDNFSVNKLKDYTQERANAHGLNGYLGQYDVSVDRFNQWVEEVIDPQFLNTEEPTE